MKHNHAKNLHKKTHYLVLGVSSFLKDYMSTYHLLGFGMAIFGITAVFPPAVFIVFALGGVIASALMVRHIFKEHKKYKREKLEEQDHLDLLAYNKKMLEDIEHEDIALKKLNESYLLAQKQSWIIETISLLMTASKEHPDEEELKKTLASLSPFLYETQGEERSHEILDERMTIVKMTVTKFGSFKLPDFEPLPFIQQTMVSPLDNNEMSENNTALKRPSIPRLMLKTAIQTTAFTIIIAAVIASLTLALSPAALFLAAPVAVLSFSVGAICFGITMGVLIQGLFKHRVVPHLIRREQIKEENILLKKNNAINEKLLLSKQALHRSEQARIENKFKENTEKSHSLFNEIACLNTKTKAKVKIPRTQSLSDVPTSVFSFFTLPDPLWTLYQPLHAPRGQAETSTIAAN